MGDSDPATREELQLGPGPPGRGRSLWPIIVLCCLVVAGAVGLWLRGERGETSQPPVPSAEQPTLLPPWDRTTAPPRGETAVDLSWLRAASDYALFARVGTDLYRAQSRSGVLVRTTLPSAGRGGARGSVVPTRHGAVIRGGGSMRLFSVPDDGPVRAFRHGEALLPGPDRGHVWVERGGSLALVRADGTPTGATIRLPQHTSGPIHPDGQGYALVRTPTGTYDVRPDSRRRVTREGVLATGPDRLLVRRCTGSGSSRRCRLVLLDGDLHRITTITGLSGEELYRSGDGMPIGVISPDHRFVALADDQDSPVQLLDLRAGRVRTLEVSTMWWVLFAAHSVLAFSPDSRWLFLIDGSNQHVAAVDVATGHVRQFLPDASPAEQIAVRP